VDLSVPGAMIVVIMMLSNLTCHGLSAFLLGGEFFFPVHLIQNDYSILVSVCLY